MELIKGKVSICMPTYNRPNLIKEILDSILNQSYKNFEVIITDNSDNNETKDVVSKYNDKRIKYCKNEKNLGMAGNTLKALSLIDGEYFTFTPDDDLWEKENLMKKINLLIKNTFINACFSNAKQVTFTGELHNQQFNSIYKELEYEIISSESLILGKKSKYFICVLTGMFRTDSMLEIFKESWLIGSEEYAMWYLGLTGQKIGFIYEKLVVIRDGDHNWEIKDKNGNLVNYRKDTELRANQLISKYTNLIKKHSNELLYLSKEFEIEFIKNIMLLVGADYINYKNEMKFLSEKDMKKIFLKLLIRQKIKSFIGK